jgi:redox-sensitive bicupin YhaK (pirin superfamily)
MMTLRKSRDRGHADHGWLDTYHSFSFADYHDGDHMGFRDLRVINEDRVAPGKGFGQHGHRDMEILTWVLEGELQHKDSMGNGDVIKPGELQYMSAGKGVLHSEFNASKTAPVHLLQIWILPQIAGATPRYGQKSFATDLAKGGLVTVASPDGAEGSLAIRQDAKLMVARAKGDETYAYPLGKQRFAWLQVARGRVRVNNTDLQEGDGVAIENEAELSILAVKGSEFLLFDLS